MSRGGVVSEFLKKKNKIKLLFNWEEYNVARLCHRLTYTDSRIPVSALLLSDETGKKEGREEGRKKMRNGLREVLCYLCVCVSKKVKLDGSKDMVNPGSFTNS